MNPFEPTESTEIVFMTRHEKPIPPAKRKLRLSLVFLRAAVLTLAFGSVLVKAANFGEDAGSRRVTEAFIGDLPAEGISALMDERGATVPLPGDEISTEATFATEEPPEDAAFATITDYGSTLGTDAEICGTGGEDCGCDQCKLRQAVGDGLIQRIHARKKSSGLTTKVRADAILLFRGPPASRPLFTTYDPATFTTGPVVFNANQLGSDPLAAPRIAVQRVDECGHGVEGAFLYAGNFYGRSTLPFVSNGYAVAPPGIYGNTWGVDNTPLSAAESTLLANLYSAEVNLYSRRGFGATRFLAGFRWLQWGEKWTMTDQFSDPLDPTVIGTDSYRTNCINNLYGGQIGLDTLLWNRGNGFRVESLVKAGAYYNAAAQSSAYDYVTNVPFGFSRQVSVNSPAACSFVGEVGLTAVIPLRRNIDLRCGYFGLWLEGIAQPLNQLSGQTLTQIDEPAGTLNTKGTVVVQGLSLGLEGRW